ncbi:hypothetical protein BaRGS_00028606 [Batillaria attramentaria]|uniref:Uncharacterized protein n=1 Tax=Batillaria attramentaria TaxID=370345 RepID=A0ABD0JZI2_9CAEN
MHPSQTIGHYTYPQSQRTSSCCPRLCEGYDLFLRHSPRVRSTAWEPIRLREPHGGSSEPLRCDAPLGSPGPVCTQSQCDRGIQSIVSIAARLQQTPHRALFTGNLRRREIEFD